MDGMGYVEFQLSADQPFDLRMLHELHRCMAQSGLLPRYILLENLLEGEINRICEKTIDNMQMQQM